MCIITGVINAPRWALEEVRSPSALKVHAVDALKAMLSAAKIGSLQSNALRTLLESSSAWQEFKDQVTPLDGMKIYVPPIRFF